MLTAPMVLAVMLPDTVMSPVSVAVVLVIASAPIVLADPTTVILSAVMFADTVRLPVTVAPVEVKATAPIVLAEPTMVRLVAVIVVKAPAAGVVAPMVALSIVPPLISAVSATSASMLAVPSINRSLNSNAVEPMLMSSSVKGRMAPSCTLI